MSKLSRTLIASATTAVLALSMVPAGPATADVVTDSMTAVPDVVHVPRTTESYPFNAADHARIPVDLDAHGYVEEEYFLSGFANVYTLADGSLAVERADVPYTNRILIRRPAAPADASGAVFVDIYNASNGYDIEDMWRRLYSHILEGGHTYVGVTSKPINVDALYQFDSERYAPLTWYDEECERVPVDMSSGDAWQEVPCTETGLAWDIVTQTGTALRDPAVGAELLGGIDPTSIVLVGQSQSGMYLNTYVNNFHQPVTEANGGHLFDGYLTAAANWLEREIRDGEAHRAVAGGIAVNGPASPVDIDVPWITVDTEGDAYLFPKEALLPRELADESRVWQIPGTSHTYSMSPVVPDNAELLKANRPARVFPEVYTPYPGEPAMWAAAEAIVAAHEKGTELPASQWFERDANDDPVRDSNGNVTGGVRYGMLELGLAEFIGAVTPGDMNGVANPISLDEFNQRWDSRAEYLAEQRTLDEALVAAGYLTPAGVELFQERSTLLLDEIGVPADDKRPGKDDKPGKGDRPSRPGLPSTGV